MLVHRSWLDRLLPLWMLLAMAGGLLPGRLLPGLQALLGSVQVDHTSLPITLGLLMMMVPVLAKVRYGELGSMTRDRRVLVAINAILQVLLVYALLEQRQLEQMSASIDQRYRDL